MITHKAAIESLESTVLDLQASTLGSSSNYLDGLQVLSQHADGVKDALLARIDEAHRQLQDAARRLYDRTDQGYNHMAQMRRSTTCFRHVVDHRPSVEPDQRTLGTVNLGADFRSRTTRTSSQTYGR